MEQNEKKIELRALEVEELSGVEMARIAGGADSPIKLDLGDIPELYSFVTSTVASDLGTAAVWWEENVIDPVVDYVSYGVSESYDYVSYGLSTTTSTVGSWVGTAWDYYFGD